MKKINVFIICAILISLIIVGCTATEVSKVKDTDSAKQITADKTQTVTNEDAKSNVKTSPLTEQTDEQILAKYDDGLDEAMKELDSIE